MSDNAVFLALVALAAGIVALVLRQRLAAEQVTAGKTAQPGYRQTPFWRIYDQLERHWITPTGGIKYLLRWDCSS